MPFSSMAGSEKIIDLRKLMAMRFPQSPMRVAEKHLVTGLGSFDQSIGGGLPQGAITELISSRGSTGSASLIHAFLHGAYRDQYFVALIDGRTSFDPSALSNSILHQLLWVRCMKTLEGVKAADLLLRDGNFPLVILDLILNPLKELRKIPQTTWYRLQRLVESMSTACLVLTRYEMVSSAQLKVVLENSWNLKNLEKPNAISQLRVVVKRSHLKSRIHPSLQYGAASSGQS